LPECALASSALKNAGLAAIITAIMARCLHILDSGLQCIDEAIEGTDFCDAHQRVVAFERDDETGALRKVMMRVIALILLLIFLIPIVNTLRTLYLGPPTRAQEG